MTVRPYQEEYIQNIKQIAALTGWRRPDGQSFEDYEAQLRENEALAERTAGRNMELLRSGLFPVLDDLLEADEETLRELEEFSFQLYNGQRELDVGLFCQIRQALLTLARQRRDRKAMIRELYWLGMGRNSLSSKLIGLGLPVIQKYIIQMRLCFTEGAAYLKYYDEIQDTETRGYILRCRANISLGQFSSPSEKVALVKKTLQILQDKGYQEKESGLPWDRFIYLTHQNMASCISYKKERVMTAQDMADIMESAYIVIQRRIQEAEEQNKRPMARSAFQYNAIQYYCGIFDLDSLLKKTEELLDTADPSDHSADGIYRMAALPAYYCQYLCQYPERVPERTKYLEGVYQRLGEYVDSFPRDQGDGGLFHALRLLSYTYVETEHSVPSEVFIQVLLMRFAPEVYVHSRIVGETAAVFCRLILEDDPVFFDDIDFIRTVSDPEEKREAVLAYAKGCGAFHDVGKIDVIELYSGNGRQWFEEEYEMAHLHTLAGEELLNNREGTRRYAAAALGHHAWYDGVHGYPDSYRRLECPARQMVDVIALVDWLDNVTRSARICTGVEKTFDEAVRDAMELEGKRFSPLLTARLRDAGTVERLREAFGQGRRDAYRQMYDDVERMGQG